MRLSAARIEAFNFDLAVLLRLRICAALEVCWNVHKNAADIVSNVTLIVEKMLKNGEQKLSTPKSLLF